MSKLLNHKCKRTSTLKLMVGDYVNFDDTNLKFPDYEIITREEAYVIWDKYHTGSPKHHWDKDNTHTVVRINSEGEREIEIGYFYKEHDYPVVCWRLEISKKILARNYEID